MSVPKGGKKSSGKANSPSPLDIKVFDNRVIVEGKIFNSVESSIERGGVKTMSSLPHLTHKTDVRDAHITSSRVVSTSEPFVIHQRFHQDNDGKSKPTHDRFFAVEQKTGTVHDVKYEFTEGVHRGRFEEKPMRGHTLDQTSGTLAKLTFVVGEEDSKHPPLSPRSVNRKVPDSGYS